MGTIDKNNPPTEHHVKTFLGSMEFSFPEGFIDFFEEANGVDLAKDDSFILLYNGNSSTAYFNRDGSYVVKDNKTGDIFK